MSPSKHPTTRLILRSPDSEDAARRFAQENCWDFSREIPQSRRKGMLRELVWRIASEVAMHYVVDDATGSPYIYFTTPWPKMGISLVRKARSDADVISYEELLADFDSAVSSEERALSLLRLSLGSSIELDNRSSMRMIAGLKDDDNRVRMAAVHATTYTPSAIYLPYLRLISTGDPSVEIRRFAENVVRVYTEMMGGG